MTSQMGTTGKNNSSKINYGKFPAIFLLAQSSEHAFLASARRLIDDKREREGERRGVYVSLRSINNLLRIIVPYVDVQLYFRCMREPFGVAAIRVRNCSGSYINTQ